MPDRWFMNYLPGLFLLLVFRWLLSRGNTLMTIADESAHGTGIPFCIRFRGELSSMWFATLQDVTLTSTSSGTTIETTLAGKAPDEGAVLGMLNMLYELGCSIISVETFVAPHN